MSVDELKRKAVDEFGEMITKINVFPDGGIDVHIVGGLFKQYYPWGDASKLLSYGGKEFPKVALKDVVIRELEYLFDTMKRFKTKGK